MRCFTCIPYLLHSVALFSSLLVATAHAQETPDSRGEPEELTTDQTPTAPAEAPAGYAADSTAANEEPSTPTEAAPEDGLAENTAFLELGGAAGFYSLNYERILAQEVGLRVGFSYLSVSASGGGSSASATWVAIPVTCNYVGFRSGKSVLELGGGITFNYWGGEGTSGGLSATASTIQPLGTLHVGYRLHPLDSGFNFRIGAMAFVGKGLGYSDPDPGEFGFLPFGYLSLGGSF